MDDNEDQAEWNKLMHEELEEKKLILFVKKSFSKLDDKYTVVDGGRIARPSIFGPRNPK